MGQYNEKGRELLLYLYFSMTEIILSENKDEADWIFWNEIVEIVEHSFVPLEKRTICFSEIMQYFTGQEEGRINYLGATKSTTHIHYSDYLRTRKKYRFAEGAGLGAYWKLLIYENKVYRLKRAVQWLEIFCREIVPTVDLIINYYSAGGIRDYIGFTYKLIRDRVSIRPQKSTNSHSLKLERCLKELKSEVERLEEIRGEQLDRIDKECT